MTNPPEHQTDLREYLRVLRARKYEVAVVTGVLVAATMFFSFRATPIYQGQAKVLVKPIVNPNSTFGVPQQPNLETERQLLLSEAVATTVRKTLNLTVPEDVLLKNLSVDVVIDTEVLAVDYRDPNPTTAARLANGFAQAYVDFRTQQALTQFEAAATAVQRRIDEIQTQLNKINKSLRSATDPVKQTSLSTQRDSLIAQLGVLRQRLLDLQSNASVAQGTAAEIIQPADVPISPVSPNKVRNGALALFAGLALGVGFAFLRERLDDRVKGRHELERRLGAPVLAAVPHVNGWKKDDEAQLVTRSEPRSPVAEAYRTLATNIQYIASQQQVKVLMVTSSMGGEGKTTTSANLAVVLAQAGKRVILVSADVRRSRIHQFFGLVNDRGLSNVLSNGAGLAQVARDPLVENLRVISGGPVPNNPAQLLGSRRTVEFLNALRDVAEVVILDTPPVLAVADASILAPLVDGTLFITDAEHSSRSAMTQSRDQLENAGARIIGVVYNNFDPSQSGAYPYYYSYYHQYYGTDEGGSHGGNGSNVGAKMGRLRRSRNQSHSDDLGSGRRAVGFEDELGDRTRMTPKGR